MFKRIYWGMMIICAFWIGLEIWPWLVQSPPNEISLFDKLTGPSAAHWFGTDELGRDVMARAAFGARLSFRTSILAWLASLFLGTLLGGIAGYWDGSMVDRCIRWVVSALFILPFLILIIAVLSIIGPSLLNSYIVLTFIAWAAPARLTRTIVMKVKTMDYVRAANAFGFSSSSIISRYVIPNAVPPVILASVAVLPEILALDAGLAFFGLGAQPPTPTIGKMIAEGLDVFSIAWWISLIPTLILGSICISINLVMKFVRGSEWT